MCFSIRAKQLLTLNLDSGGDTARVCRHKVSMEHSFRPLYIPEELNCPGLREGTESEWHGEEMKAKKKKKKQKTVGEAEGKVGNRMKSLKCTGKTVNGSDRGGEMTSL